VPGEVPVFEVVGCLCAARTNKIKSKSTSSSQGKRMKKRGKGEPQATNRASVRINGSLGFSRIVMSAPDILKTEYSTKLLSLALGNPKFQGDLSVKPPFQTAIIIRYARLVWFAIVHSSLIA
jgi:hypothetical protein